MVLLLVLLRFGRKNKQKTVVKQLRFKLNWSIRDQPNFIEWTNVRDLAFGRDDVSFEFWYVGSAIMKQQRQSIVGNTGWTR